MEGIVVGVDESAGAAHALRWAAREGRLRDLPVTAVMAWGFLDQHHAVPDAPFDSNYSAADARDALDTIVAGILGPEVSARTGRATPNELPAAALLEAAEGADLVVVGARGLGGFRGLLIGSVSQHVLHHADVPVAVIRGEVVDPPDGDERIVVGVDGSATSLRALAWALDEARLRRAAVEVVHTWQVPTIVSPYGEYGALDTSLEPAARQVLDDVMATADVHDVPTPIVQTVASGSAARAILDAARDADLVVIGSRGLGGFKGLLLGSVSHQVTHHAACPVVVLPTVE
jgi:nucleotide-binding universal stress UspA family protein